MDGFFVRIDAVYIQPWKTTVDDFNEVTRQLWATAGVLTVDFVVLRDSNVVLKDDAESLTFARRSMFFTKSMFKRSRRIASCSKCRALCRALNLPQLRVAPERVENDWSVVPPGTQSRNRTLDNMEERKTKYFTEEVERVVKKANLVKERGRETDPSDIGSALSGAATASCGPFGSTRAEGSVSVGSGRGRKLILEEDDMRCTEFPVLGATTCERRCCNQQLNKDSMYESTHPALADTPLGVLSQPHLENAFQLHGAETHYGRDDETDEAAGTRMGSGSRRVAHWRKVGHPSSARHAEGKTASVLRS